MGEVDFWFRMRVPMETAMRLYREKAKAEALLAVQQRRNLQEPAGGWCTF